jgi:hypothetical protein
MSSIRKIIDNLLLLEDMLFHNDKECSKCIKEKFLYIEKLIENIIESDKKDIYFYPIVFPMLDKLRKIQKKYPNLSNDDLQNLRRMRKNLMNKCFKEQDNNKNVLEKKINHKCRQDLLPILDVRFNLREAVKNMLLVEDHLLDKRRRCMDCCKKHMLLIESFLEEGISLDKNGIYKKKFEKEIKKIRGLQKKLLEGRKNYFNIAMCIKRMRKKYINESFDYVKECV